MRYKLLMVIALLIANDLVLAEENVFEGAAKNIMQQTVQSAVQPEAAKGAAATEEAVKEANALKENIKSEPARLKGQTEQALKQSAKQELEAATPPEAKQAVETIKKDAKTAKNIKKNVKNIPQSTKELGRSIENDAAQKATQKAFDLLN